jgi:hypothetical protein
MLSLLELVSSKFVVLFPPEYHSSEKHPVIFSDLVIMPLLAEMGERNLHICVLLLENRQGDHFFYICFFATALRSVNTHVNAHILG